MQISNAVKIFSTQNLKYLQAYSKIPVKLTKKFEGDLEGKINAELKMVNQELKILEKYAVCQG